MGNTIWVQVDDGDPGVTERDNSIMLRLEKELDALASKLDVAKPSSFYDYSGLEADFTEILEEANPEGKPSEPRWWSSTSGLRSVSALLDELRARPKAIGFPTSPSKKHWPDLLIEELEHCRDVLQQATADKKKFRFLIVG